MDNLRPYDSLKPSGTDWIGEVPSHWRVKRLCTVSRVRNELDPGNLDLLSVFLDRGVIPYAEGGGQVHAPSIDLTKYQVVRPGDLVLNNQQAWRGSVGVSQRLGIISPAYVVLSLGDNFEPTYANHLFRSRALVDQYVIASKGVGDIQRQISMPLLRNLVVPVPPDSEQTAISEFIRHIDRIVDRHIRSTRRLVRSLIEQKQAQIHEELVRPRERPGRLKPSGVDWIGDIPEHWKIMRARFLFREVDERSDAGSEQHLSMSQKLGLVPATELPERRLHSVSYAGAKVCRPGDIVLNRLKAHLGVFATSKYHGVISPDYTVLRPNDQALSDYYTLALRSPMIRRELRVRAKGIVEGFWRLYTDDFYDLRLPHPPPEEQAQIVQRINELTIGADRAISLVERELALISEYRARLVAEVVVGKLDVREVALSLRALDVPTGEHHDEGVELSEIEDLVDVDEDLLTDVEELA